MTQTFQNNGKFWPCVCFYGFLPDDLLVDGSSPKAGGQSCLPESVVLILMLLGLPVDDVLVSTDLLLLLPCKAVVNHLPRSVLLSYRCFDGTEHTMHTYKGYAM